MFEIFQNKMLEKVYTVGPTLAPITWHSHRRPLEMVGWKPTMWRMTVKKEWHRSFPRRGHFSSRLFQRVELGHTSLSYKPADFPVTRTIQTWDGTLRKRYAPCAWVEAGHILTRNVLERISVGNWWLICFLLILILCGPHIGVWRFWNRGWQTIARRQIQTDAYFCK